MGDEEKYASLEARLGYKFRNRALLQTALTHKSLPDKQSYERLEFLGDRLLGFTIAEALYKRFPQESEGSLSKRLAAAVSASRLAEIAKNWRLAESIKLGDDLRAQGFAEQGALQADICEALLAAIYLDSDKQELQRVILLHWHEAIEDEKAKETDARSRLQEWCQAHALPLPLYETIDIEGPPHDRRFTISVSVQSCEQSQDASARNHSAQAKARSKKEAMFRAAEAMLEQLNEIEASAK